MDFFTSEPMRYFAPSASMSKEARRAKLEQMAASDDYIYSQKIDGNWARAIITPERSALQTRGISVKTHTYGEIQDKVYFWNDMTKAFTNTTVFLGEVFLPGKIDRDIGSILRCLPDKALARQKNEKLQFYIFDVLCFEGTELLNIRIEERIKYIPKVVSCINSELVKGATYKPMTNNFFDEMQELFNCGAEGAVCYKKDALYIPGKRGPHAWDSCKVKQEISSEIDCFITGIVPCEKLYNGEDIANWEFWQNSRTGELVQGLYFGEYQNGGPYIPVSKNFWHGWPGAIQTGIYNSKGEIIPLCKVAGLTDEFKEQLRDNPEEWRLCPITIGGMMISEARANANGEGISIRHPILRSIRKDDLNPSDCTLAKIYSNEA